MPALNAPFDRVSAEIALFVIRTAFLGDRDAARFAYLDGAARAARGGRCGAPRRRASPSGGGRPAPRGRSRDRCEAERRGRRRVRCLRHRRATRRLGAILGDAPASGVDGLDAYAPCRSSTCISGTTGRRSASTSPPCSTRRCSGSSRSRPATCAAASARLRISFSARSVTSSSSAAGSWPSVLPEAARARLVRGAATRNPEATFLPAPGVRRARPSDRLLQPRHRGIVDRHRLARHDGIGRPQRSHRGAHALQQCCRMVVFSRQGERVACATQEVARAV